MTCTHAHTQSHAFLFTCLSSDNWKWRCSVYRPFGCDKEAKKNCTECILIVGEEREIHINDRDSRAGNNLICDWAQRTTLYAFYVSQQSISIVQFNSCELSYLRARTHSHTEYGVWQRKRQYTTTDDSRAKANISIYLIFKITNKKQRALKLDLFISMLNVFLYIHVYVCACLAIRFSINVHLRCFIVGYWRGMCLFVTIIYTFERFNQRKPPHSTSYDQFHFCIGHRLLPPAKRKRIVCIDKAIKATANSKTKKAKEGKFQHCKLFSLRIVWDHTQQLHGFIY